MSGFLLYLLLTSLLLHSSSADTPLAQNCEGNTSNRLLRKFEGREKRGGQFDSWDSASHASTNQPLRLPELHPERCGGRAFPLPQLQTSHPMAANFIQLQRVLLRELMDQAAYNSSLMFATGAAVNGSDMRVTGLAQCTRDLSMDRCSQCMQQIHALYANTIYEARVGGRVLGKSCNFRYEVYPFYHGNTTVLLNFTAPLPPPPSPFAMSPLSPSTSTGEGSKDDTKKVLIIVIPIVVVMLLLIAVSIFFWRKRATKHTRSIGNQEEISNVDLLLLDLSTIKVATDYFSESNKLGEGGFGSVYKGKLDDGQEIAIKRLSTSSTQGIEELKNEFSLVAKLQHRNLVKLLGVCLEEQEKLIVYEYVPNGSLDILLLDPIKCKQLEWVQKFNIIGGIARGLFYLHEESRLKVIHRDLKASNILLDAEMNPKISDFGLARLFGGDETQGTTSQVVGTIGYMAPEYALHGHFSTKVDVFSYGVLVLEIVTGRKSHSIYDSERAEDFLSYVWEHWSNGTILEILDPSLENCSKNEVLRCIHIALLCVQEVPSERPPMSPPHPKAHPLDPPLSRGSPPYRGPNHSKTQILLVLEPIPPQEHLREKFPNFTKIQPRLPLQPRLNTGI